MSSNSQLPTKPAAAAPPSNAAAPPPSLPSDSRRASSSSASTAPRPPAAPRNAQAARKNHKNHRKPPTPHYDDHIEEAAMALPTSRRGTSITHLMNWNVASPRPDTHYRRSTRRTPTWGLGSGYHAADKARYINANYRFLVHPRGDYRAQSTSPDIHLPWDLVLQILASDQTQRTSCPICLSTPVAPRMAKCGHIFCLPCLLRYMASTEDPPPHLPHPPPPLPTADKKKPRYRKCVICTDSIYISETRPVRFFTGEPQPREGEDVVLRLMTRQQGSTLALPRDGAEEPDDGVPWHFAAEVMEYARVMKGTENYMTSQYIREISNLEQMEREDELMFGEDGEWTQKAVSAIRLAMEGIKGMGNPPAEPKAKEKATAATTTPRSGIIAADVTVAPAFYHIAHEASSGHPSSSSSSSTPTETKGPHDAPYFFYQALLHYYLSPLDIRILRAAFGTYAAFPTTLLPHVETITQHHSVDDELRKRAKYLAHLPAGCEVAFLDCDWTDVVAPEVLEGFRGEIERRRKKRVEKEGREERERVKAEEAAVRWRKEGAEEGWRGEEWVALAGESAGDFTGEDVTVGVRELTVETPVEGSRTVWGTPLVLPPGETQKGDGGKGGWREWERGFLDDETLDRLEGKSAATGAGKGKGKRKFKKVTLMTNGGKRGA